MADVVALSEQLSNPEKSVRTVPANVERRFFPETRVTGFRLAA